MRASGAPDSHVAFVAPLAVRQAEPHPQPDCAREVVSRLLVETPTLMVGRWRCPVNSPFFADSGPARHYLCVFPRTGVWICHAGRKPFVADPSVVTYYNPGLRYSRRAIDARGDRCEWFGVPHHVAVELLGAHETAVTDRHDVFSFTHGPCDGASYLTQRAVFEHICREERPDTLYVEESMLAVLRRVLGAAHPRRSQRPSARPGAGRRSTADLAEAARAELARGFARSWSLTDLATRLDTSAFHLARAFRRHTGWSLHQYRTELRTRAALESLNDPGVDLVGLALSLGFSSHSHFTDTFRRRFGAPPSVVRRRFGMRGLQRFT